MVHQEKVSRVQTECELMNESSFDASHVIFLNHFEFKPLTIYQVIEDRKRDLEAEVETSDKISKDDAKQNLGLSMILT